MIWPNKTIEKQVLELFVPVATKASKFLNQKYYQHLKVPDTKECTAYIKKKSVTLEWYPILPVILFPIPTGNSDFNMCSTGS